MAIGEAGGFTQYTFTDNRFGADPDEVAEAVETRRLRRLAVTLEGVG